MLVVFFYCIGSIDCVHNSVLVLSWYTCIRADHAHHLSFYDSDNFHISSILSSISYLWTNLVLLATSYTITINAIHNNGKHQISLTLVWLMIIRPWYQRYYDVTIDTNEAILYPGNNSDWTNKLPSELDRKSILQKGAMQLISTTRNIIHDALSRYTTDFSQHLWQSFSESYLLLIRVRVKALHSN